MASLKLFLVRLHAVTPVGMKADEKEIQSALCKRSAALFRLGLDAHAVTWTGPEKAMGIDAAMLELRESPRAAEVLRDVADFLAQNKGLEAWAFWVRPGCRWWCGGSSLWPSRA